MPNTMQLNNLKPAKGATKDKLRVGRGRASGAGKTANRGHNGQGQRSGESAKRGFEGGQMPLYRRIPKFRSFPQPGKLLWLEMNVSDLEAKIPADIKEITYDVLKAQGLLKSKFSGLRILGNGNVTRALKVSAHHVTASAKEKIEKAGGSVTIIEDAPAAD